MIRLSGVCKVAAVFMFDFLAIYTLFHSTQAATVVTGVIALYVWLGGYFTLFKEGAVRSDKLPQYERSRLEKAKAQLIKDVKRTSSADISNLRVYLIPGDSELQATAYGSNCISVSKGTFDNTDPMTLNAVLGHEISHTLHMDAEFSRAVFATILLVCGAISVISFVFVVIIFLIFLVCCLFRSWLGVMAYKGTTKVVKGIFQLFQKGFVVIYQVVAGYVSRVAEFRCDRYSAQLGYGVQLAHFLSYAVPEYPRQMTLTEALYRSHPSSAKRVARLEAFIREETQPVIR